MKKHPEMPLLEEESVNLSVLVGKLALLNKASLYPGTSFAATCGHYARSLLIV